jgi:lipoprotein-anchoring transpeptidase ErfK/SrfK
VSVVRGTGRFLTAMMLAAGIVILPATTAFADDAPPAPTVATDTPSPTPSTDASTDPAITDPANSPSTPPLAPPVTPSKPAVKPPAKVVNSKLPLKRGARGERVLEAQQRLQWLGYPLSPIDTTSMRVWASTTAAVKKFQMKQFLKATGDVDQKTWDRLNKVAGVVGRLPDACMHERTLCVDKTQRLLRLVEGGAVQLTLDARFGMAGTTTREGAFRVNRKSRDHMSTLYHTWMPFAMFFSGGQAVHYSPFFARDGYYGGSHGCIGVRDIKQAQWMFDRIPIGTKVYVYWS